MRHLHFGQQPLIRPREVHVWTVRLIVNCSHLNALYQTCSKDEKQKAEGFRYEYHKKLFVTRRGVLRAILGAYLGCLPEHLQFQYGPKGKPALQGAGASLHFSMAHSAGCAVYALTSEKELGVDVEELRELEDAEIIAEQFFSRGECKDLLGISRNKRTEAFLNCWTRKEAYLKAVGDGLSAPLDGFRVSIRPAEPAVFLRLDDNRRAASRWSLFHLDPAEGYVGALAIRALDCTLVEQTFPNVEECLTKLQSLRRE